MSGTSLDGIDGVLVDFAPAAAPAPLKVLAHVHGEFEPALRASLLALNRSGADEIHRAALAGNALARAYAQVVEDLLVQAGVAHEAVAAIGCHGQTVRHRPREFDATGYTVQINAPALLAELSAVDVVADFRSRDVAAGGQGAPLVPAFHRALFAPSGKAAAVLNLGGIANLSAIEPDGAVTGFDCGPANALLDLWSASSSGRRFDD
ncbi:MAG: anhydro-N-acetylmuramic acid kinase, partial [Caldimonas sp.]